MKPQANGIDLPEMPIDLDTDAKQEAARFLASTMDARPMIRGIDDEQRLADWEAVADHLDLESRQERALRQRREAVDRDRVDADEAFEAASELAEPSVDAESEPAVADGGAVVDDEPSEIDLNDGQELMEYEDDAEQESKRREAASIATMFDEPGEVREKIAEEHDRDVVRPHVLDALKERLEVLDG